MKVYRIIFLLAAVTCFVISACRKSDRENDTETQTATDNSIAEYATADVFTQLIKAAATQADLYTPAQTSSGTGCPAITIAPAPPVTGFPKVLTIDYGATNCAGSDGINRKGKIRASFTNALRSSTTVITLTYSNYYVNDNLVEGEIKITSRGKNSSNHLYYSVTSGNISITNTYGKSYWKCSRTHEWITGDTSATLSDDLFAIRGTGSGTGVKGNAYTTTITKDLQINNVCGYIKEGIIKVTPANLEPRTLDFGTGSCDNQVDISINGSISTVVLK